MYPLLLRFSFGYGHIGNEVIGLKRRIAYLAIALTLALTGFSAWSIGDKPAELQDRIVNIIMDYDYPVLTLSVTPPEAAEYIVISLSPQLGFQVDRDEARISITLEAEGYSPIQEYILTANLQEGHGFAMSEPYSFAFLPPEKAFDLVAVGDVMLDQITSARLRDYDVNYPLARISHITGAGDLNFANLEAPISAQGKQADKKYVFRAPPYSVEVLKIGGFNVVSLANNHVLDYGPLALLDTIDILEQNNIAHAGAGANEEAARRGVLMELNGVKVAVLAYTRAAPGWQYPLWAAGADKPGTVFYMDQDKMIQDLERARAAADVVIVSMHWGNEYTYSVNANQRQMGRLLVDNGADLILGHHSHAPQGIEFYKDKPIVYGLGNFLFYPFELGLTDETYILKARIGMGGVENLRLVPVLLGDSQPFVPEGRELERMLGVLGMLLDRFDTGYTIEGNEVIIKMP
jgi:poly-gamma-glutamate synthesis protein (capsule biosynthesis protein)